MKAGRFADACPRLQQSQQLDPAMGTKYRLAECYESAGLVGSAWTLFTEVAGDARAAGRSDREAQASKHAAALLPRLPRMNVGQGRALAVRPARRRGDPRRRARRSVRLGAHAVAVDLGRSSRSAARAPGKSTWQETVRSLEGGSIDVSVPPLSDGEGPGGSMARPGPDSASPSP